MISPDTWVPLAEVARPHGVKGELRLKVFNRDSDALLTVDEVLVRLPSGEEHEVSVDGARPSDQAVLMKLHSVGDRDRAEELRGALICVKRKDFPATDEGEFYVCDIIGATVRLSDESTPFGTVGDIRTYPSVDCLIVKANDGGADVEVPLVDAFVEKVDGAAGEVVLRSLDGVVRG